MLPAWSVSQLRLGKDLKGQRLQRQQRSSSAWPGRYSVHIGSRSSVVTVAVSVTPRGSLGLLGQFVYQADPGDPGVLIGAVVTMALIGVAGAAIPALRAPPSIPRD
jgi:hypothetical protein